MEERLNILMVSAENDGVENCKVGGVADVVRDLPEALMASSAGECFPKVVTPSYGRLHKYSGAELRCRVRFRFADRDYEAELYAIPAKNPASKVEHYAIHHEAMVTTDADNNFTIFNDDSSDRPFATDALRYAFFCRAVAQALLDNAFGSVDVLHLHDWHTGFLPLLIRFCKIYHPLQSIPIVFTIHNLEMQGIRPISGPDPSSLFAWYSDLEIRPDEWPILKDPRYHACINPMAIGIRLAKTVTTVSPSYAKEILLPNDAKRGYYGGEGLQEDLIRVNDEGRLRGILNGCFYSGIRETKSLPLSELAGMLSEQVAEWIESDTKIPAIHASAFYRLQRIASKVRRYSVLCTTVGRVTKQKIDLFRQFGTNGISGLDQILKCLEEHRGLYILLGKGLDDYVRYLYEKSLRHPNFIFLYAQSTPCAEALYRNGDLFLMPSLSEPCGISQMLAMRDGQPCLVHNVGGLKDTVTDGWNGFVFQGEDPQRMVDDMIATFQHALQLKEREPNRWLKIRERAASSRFLWDSAAATYLTEVY